MGPAQGAALPPCLSPSLASAPHPPLAQRAHGASSSSLARPVCASCTGLRLPADFLPPLCCRPLQAALDKVKELASAPRLASGDYGELSRVLRKILQKDSIIAVAAAAADAAAALAQGLRGEFSSHAKVRACGCVALLRLASGAHTRQKGAHGWDGAASLCCLGPWDAAAPAWR